MPGNRSSALYSSAAPMNATNSGCGRVGRLFSSGCAWVPTMNGWTSAAYSTNSTRCPSGRGAGEPQPALRDAVAVLVVDLVAVAVPLGHLGGLICLRHNRTRLQHGRIGAQPHGAAEVRLTGDGVALVGHRGDHRIGCLRIELRGVGLGEPDRARRLDDDALQPEAQAENRQSTLAGVGDGADLALDAANAEPAGNQHAVHIAQRGGGAASVSQSSEATQRISTLARCLKPPARNASATDR